MRTTTAGNEGVDTTPGKLTPYLGLDETLIGHAHASQDILQHNLVGLYLLGSLAIGDFDLTSDVNFVIVTKNELSDDEVAPCSVLPHATSFSGLPMGQAPRILVLSHADTS